MQVRWLEALGTCCACCIRLAMCTRPPSAAQLATWTTTACTPALAPAMSQRLCMSHLRVRCMHRSIDESAQRVSSTVQLSLWLPLVHMACNML